MAAHLRLRYAARTDVGKLRSKNDDSAYAGQYLAVVADGMGGHVGGDVASASTVLDLVHLDRDGYQSDAEIQLADEIQTANSLLSEMVHINPKLAGMGTTVTAILLSEGKLAFAHIGDSRAYRLKNGTFEQLSKDHTFVQRLIDEGRLTPEEAEVHPHKNVIMRVLGDVDASPELDIDSIEAHPGERWLLCSDGLNYVNLEVVEDVVRNTPSLATAADKLIELTLEAGAPDNVTVVLVDVVEASENETAAIDTEQVRNGAASSAALGDSGEAQTAENPVIGATRASDVNDDVPPSQPAEENDGYFSEDELVDGVDRKAIADLRDDDDELSQYRGSTSSERAANLLSDDDQNSDSARMIGEHIAEDVVEEELAQRPHELVGAATTAYRDGKIPHVASRAKRGPRASALLTHRDDASSDDDVVLITESPRRRSWLTWLIAASVVIVIGLAGILGYSWTQTQYYVGESNGNVAIYKGVSQPLGPFALSHVQTETGIQLSSLSPYVQSRVQQTLTATSLRDAEQIVRDIQDGKVPSSSSNPSPSPSPSGSPSSKPSSTSGSPSTSEPPGTPAPGSVPTSGSTDPASSGGAR